jgi:hypothetical protein
MVGIAGAVAVVSAVAAIASWRSSSAARDAARILREEREEERSYRDTARVTIDVDGMDFVFRNAGPAQARDVTIEPRSSGVKLTLEARRLAVLDADQMIRIPAIAEWSVDDIELELAWTDGTGRHHKPVVLRLSR